MHKIYVGIHITGFPCGSAGKESICNVGDLGSIPGLERSPGEGKGYLLQYSGLENSMNCIVYGIAKSQVWLSNFWAFLVAQLVKKPPAMQDTWVWSLGWEDPLEEGMATHSNILAWRIPWTIQSMGLQRVRHNWATFTFTCNIGKGNGNPLRYSCLGNPMDRGAWWGHKEVGHSWAT